MKSRKLISLSVIALATVAAASSFLVANNVTSSWNNVANADNTYTLELGSSNGVISDTDYSSGTVSATTTSGNTFTLTYSGAKASSGNLCMLDALNSRSSNGGTSDGELSGSINGMSNMVINFSYSSTVGSLAVYFSSDGSSWSDAVLASSGLNITPSGSYFKIVNLGQPVTIESIVFTYACDEDTHSYASSAAAEHATIADSELTGYAPSGTLSSDFAYGVDMSEVAELEELGGVFYNENGVAEDPFAIMANDGVNYVRLRLWVNPYTTDGEAYGGGTNDLATDIMMAKRAQAAGLKIMIDLHYSDSWTDPSKYWAPKSWGTGTAALVTSYTTSVMQAFADAGVTVDAVQIGNEINPGIAGVTAGTDEYYDMLNAGVAAVKSVFSSAKTILHVTNVHRSTIDSFIANLCTYVTDFDILGVSYYPYWQGTMTNLLDVLNLIASYGKQSMILETAYGWTDDYDENYYSANQYNSSEEGVEGTFDTSTQGQVDMMSALIDTCSQADAVSGSTDTASSCVGVFYWGADWIPVSGSTWATKAGQYYNDNGTDYTSSSDLDSYTDDSCRESWSNQALFDYNGKASGAAQVYKLIKNATSTWSGEVKNTTDIDYYSVDSDGNWGTAVALTYSGRTDDNWVYTVSLSEGDLFSFVVQSDRATWNDITGTIMAAVDSTNFAASETGGDTVEVQTAGLYTFTIDDDISTVSDWSITSNVTPYISVVVDTTSDVYTQDCTSVTLKYVNSSGTWDSTYDVDMTFDYYTNTWTGSIHLDAGEGLAIEVNSTYDVNGWYLNLVSSAYFTQDSSNNCGTAGYSGTYSFTVYDNLTVTDDTSDSFYTVVSGWSNTDIPAMISFTFTADDTSVTYYTQDCNTVELYPIETSSGSASWGTTSYFTFDATTNTWSIEVELTTTQGIQIGVSDGTDWYTVGGWYVYSANSTYFSQDTTYTSGNGGIGLCNTAGTYTITVNDNLTVTDDTSNSFFTSVSSWTNADIIASITITLNS